MAGSNINANAKPGFFLAVAATVAAFDGMEWTADLNYDLIDIAESHTVAGAAANIEVRKATPGTAKASGVLMHATSGFSAAGTANTPVVLGPSTTAANARLARGDRVCVGISGASAGLAGVNVTVRLKALSQLG